MNDENLLMVDGVLLDRETLESVESSTENNSDEKIHDISYSVDPETNTINISVVRSDGKSWEWDIQSTEFVQALNIIKDYEEIKSGASDLVEKLDALALSSNNLLTEVQDMVETPKDFYEFTADICTQIIFFISLIFGLLCFLVFSLSFRK